LPLSPLPHPLQLPALEKPHLTITRGSTLVHVALYLLRTLQEQDPGILAEASCLPLFDWVCCNAIRSPVTPIPSSPFFSDFAQLSLETAHLVFFIEQTGVGAVVQGPRKKLETVAHHFRQTDAGRPLIIYYATKDSRWPPDAGVAADRKASHKRAATEGAEAASEA
jgi:hypothetical protein